MNRRILAVIIAVLLAVAGAAMVLVYAKNADKRAIAAAQPSTVWVAEKVVPAGTPLKDAERTELIVKTQVAATAVPQGALQDVNADNNSLLALSDIQPGEYLLSARFGSTPVGTKAIEVPSGKVAVSVELTEIETIPGVRAATPIGQVLDRSDSGFGTRLIDGIDFEDYAQLTGLKIREGRQLGSGDEAIMDPEWQQNRRAAVGDTVQLFERPFTGCSALSKNHPAGAA